MVLLDGGGSDAAFVFFEMEIRMLILVALLLFSSCRARREERRSLEWLQGYEARRAETLRTQSSAEIRTSSAVWERVVMERDTAGRLVVTERVVERYEAADTAAADSQLFGKDIAVDSVSAEKGVVVQVEKETSLNARKTASAAIVLFCLAAMLVWFVSLYLKNINKRRL